MDFTIAPDFSSLALDGICEATTASNLEDSIRHCRIQYSDCSLGDFLAAGPHYEPF